MKNILITGATGNVGTAVLKHLSPAAGIKAYKATRKKQTAGDELYFDFEDLRGSLPTLQKTDVLFLLRPPHLSDVKKYFAPLVQACKDSGVQHVLFLSVQGADKASFIPHAKIEKLLFGSGLSYTVFRPSYFMQNLTTTLRDDIQKRNLIFLPAGRAPFLWIDVEDIGRCIAQVLMQSEEHRNKIYTLTGRDLLSFGEVARLLSAALGRTVRYQSPSLFSFYATLRRRNVPTAFILVMIMLHYLPRFQKPPQITDDVQRLTGEAPNTLERFMQKHKATWQ